MQLLCAIVFSHIVTRAAKKDLSLCLIDNKIDVKA